MGKFICGNCNSYNFTLTLDDPLVDTKGNYGDMIVIRCFTCGKVKCTVNTRLVNWKDR
jgi:hypothetical protein